eukprot:4128245-Alexandrium_andersonii.AAC.1
MAKPTSIGSPMPRGDLLSAPRRATGPGTGPERPPPGAFLGRPLAQSGPGRSTGTSKSASGHKWPGPARAGTRPGPFPAKRGAGAGTPWRACTRPAMRTAWAYSAKARGR